MGCVLWLPIESKFCFSANTQFVGWQLSGDKSGGEKRVVEKHLAVEMNMTRFIVYIALWKFMSAVYDSKNNATLRERLLFVLINYRVNQYPKKSIHNKARERSTPWRPTRVKCVLARAFINMFQT